MSDGDRLLKAILDDPADMAARLVYADWLEEHSLAHPLRLASMRGGRPRWGKEARWQWAFPEFAECAHDLDAEVEIDGRRVRKRQDPAAAWLCFRRGFLAECAVRLDWWLKRGPDWVAGHPVGYARVFPYQDWADARPTSHAWMPGGRGNGTYLLAEDGRTVRGFIHYPWVPHNGIWARIAGDPDLDRKEFASAEEAACAVSAACLGWARCVLASRGP